MNVQVRGFLLEDELASCVREARAAAFELNDRGIEEAIQLAARTRARRAVEAYVREASAELMKLAAENKRLRDRLGKRAKRPQARERVADVIEIDSCRKAFAR